MGRKMYIVSRPGSRTYLVGPDWQVTQFSHISGRVVLRSVSVLCTYNIMNVSNNYTAQKNL